MKQYKIFKLFVAIVIAIFTLSCSTDFRTIDGEAPESDKVDVPIDVDNSNIDVSGVDPELADEFTVIFYPIDGSKPTIFIVDSDTPNISVKKGDYSVIIFNGLFDNHDGLLFGDINNYETIKVYLSEIDLEISKYFLYSDSLDLINISEDTSKLKFVLTDIFTTIHVTTYVSSINLLSTKNNYTIVDGLASGMYLYNRQPTLDEPISVNMPFSIYAYNIGSTVNGYLRGQFKSFGVYESEDGEQNNNAALYLKLDDADDGYQQFKRNITDDINIMDDDDQVLSVEIPNIMIVQ